MIKVSTTTKGGAVGKAAETVKAAVAGAKGAKGKTAKDRSAAPSTVKVTFALPVSETPEAVSVCGDFNGWDPLAHPLKKRANGTRSVSLDLPPGRYAFKYLSGSGTWFTDPEAHAHEANEYGETNSIIELG